MSNPNPERRSERARQAILRAAIELCQDPGFAKATMEAIAKRAGVGKQTIYRWWPSKAAVVLEALHEHAGETTEFPDTGDVVADLRTQMHLVARLMTGPAFAAYASGLIAGAQADPALSEALLATMIEPRAEACRKRLAKAQDDGQLRRDADLGAVVELLYGPLYYRLLLHNAPITSAQVDTVLELAFAGLRPVGAATA